MQFRLVCCVLALAQLSSGLVQFKKSTMYNIYDFHQVKEVPLRSCEGGCLVFASITEEGADYMERLVLHNNVESGSEGAVSESIASIARRVRPGYTGLKAPLELSFNGTYSIRNNNSGTPSDVAVYVVDLNTARALNYEIYDAASMARPVVVPRTIVTVMGAKKFVVRADKGAANSFTARLAGFDNALADNADSCIDAYQTNTFEGFEFHVHGPIVSIVFDKKNLVAIRATYNYWNARSLSMPGFITSPGYHGCAGVNPMEVYRQWNFDFGFASYELNSMNPMKLTFNATINVSDAIIFLDKTNNGRWPVHGQYDGYQLTMDNTKDASLYYEYCSPPNGFVARHSATKA